MSWRTFLLIEGCSAKGGKKGGRYKMERIPMMCAELGNISWIGRLLAATSLRTLIERNLQPTVLVLLFVRFSIVAV